MFNRDAVEKFFAKIQKTAILKTPNGDPLPTQIDYRDKGAVTAVKDQGFGCGSSPYFAGVGSIEAAAVLYDKTPLTSLSTQQVIDCCLLNNYTNGCYGCSGSYYEGIFEYVIDFGLEAEKDYPYNGNGNNCSYDKTKTVTKISKFGYVETGDELTLQQVLATIGPVAAACCVDSGFMNYKGGVYSNPSCLPKTCYPDHGVLIIGYGVDLNVGLEYYILKNTWGASWGENGYIRVARNTGNMCGVASYPYYPIH